MPLRDAAPVGAPCWIELFTSDTEAATTFYAALFGWTAETAGPEYGGYINLSKDELRVAGCMHNDGEQGMPNVWTIYLASDDAAATCAAAKEAGGQVYLDAMQVMDLGTMAMVADPDGAAIGVWQPGTHTGFAIFDEVDTPAWFELLSKEYDAAVAFYSTVFDWDVEVASDTPEFRYTTLGHGEDQLAGVMDAAAFLPEGVPSHWSVYFRVADADAACARVVELGGSVMMPPEDTPYGRLATVVDPTGANFKVLGPNVAEA